MSSFDFAHTVRPVTVPLKTNANSHVFYTYWIPIIQCPKFIRIKKLLICDYISDFKLHLHSYHGVQQPKTKLILNPHVRVNGAHMGILANERAAMFGYILLKVSNLIVCIPLTTNNYIYIYISFFPL